VFTNPQYLATSKVFPGCDDGKLISPAAVGGITACAVVAFVVVCGVGLWVVRKFLYRNPVQNRRRRRGREREAESGMEMGGGLKRLRHGGGGLRRGITVTREIRVEGNERVEEYVPRRPPRPVLRESVKEMGYVPKRPPRPVLRESEGGREAFGWLELREEGSKSGSGKSGGV
jgi:hypothetical protein